MLTNNTATADFRQVPNETIRLDAINTKPQKLAPYGTHVLNFLRTGKQPNLCLFAGFNCWNRAEGWQRSHGSGTTLVLPDGVCPASLKWPPVDSLVVAWPPDNKPNTYRRKLELAQALIRDGVRFIAIQHEPEFLYVYAEGGRRQ